jgi:hypothetical protein
MKVHGESRTAVVARLINEKARLALRASDIEKAELAQEIAKRQSVILDLNSALALLQLAMEELRSAVWSTDLNLRISVIANGEIPNFHKVMDWEVGKTIHEVFHTTSNDHPAVAAHFSAVNGVDAETAIAVNGDEMVLTVKPLRDEDDSIIGCIGVMSKEHKAL